jgi:hypothetical protein
VSWYWIAVSAVGPVLLGLLIAWPLWRNNQGTLGSTIGASIIFICGAALIGREYMELERLTEACVEATGFECIFDPAPFTRFAAYASIALVQVFALFLIGVRFEERRRRMDYAPEWRR